MATKSFVDKNDVSEFETYFKESLKLMFDKGESWLWLMQKLSFHLEHYLIEKLQRLPQRNTIKCISLGSWSRSELCPRSDIDVILIGEEENLRPFLKEAEDVGVYLKYRKPKDLNDWSVGVDYFDLLALMKSRAVDSSIKQVLTEQKRILFDKVKHEKLDIKWVNLMYEERLTRNERYDSLANYLEPNLKYGPGGLRDAEQTSVTIKLFPERFNKFKTELSFFENCKAFLLVVRYLLHLKGGSDILDAQTSKLVAKDLGYSQLDEFNMQVQKNIYEVNFFTQLVREVVALEKLPEPGEINGVKENIKFLLDDTNLIRQNIVKKNIKKIDLEDIDKHHFRDEFVKINNENVMLALYQSEVLFKLFPHLRRCHGKVQYDHYHRYTVDAHTVQALRVYCQCLQNSEQVLGKNHIWFDELNENEREVLLWSLMYHDLAKGLKGSHSELGAQIVLEELGLFGLPSQLIQEVSWQVKNHLILSEASFRKNPEDPSTWQWISSHGSNPHRLKVLACLTAVDIIATNKDAWTPWKSNLLFRLVTQILSPQVTGFLELSDKMKGVSTEEKQNEFINEFAPMLFGQFDIDIILDDFKRLSENSIDDLPVRWVQGVDGYLWVRFHKHKDTKGLFLEWCKHLYSLSCPIREAYIHTYLSYGAYDWMKIKTTKSLAVLEKQFNLIDVENVKVKSVKFESIKILDHPHPTEWLVKFKGVDQEGALLGAVSKIFEHDLEIIWARVHTWGEVLEDVFSLKGERKNIDALINENLLFKIE